jgi:hypothetical protein
LIDFILANVLFYFGVFTDMPIFNFEGLLWQLLIHVTLIEFVYYWYVQVIRCASESVRALLPFVARGD